MDPTRSNYLTPFKPADSLRLFCDVFFFLDQRKRRTVRSEVYTKLSRGLYLP